MSEDGLRLTMLLDAIRDSADSLTDPRMMFERIRDLLLQEFSADSGVILLLEEGREEIDILVATGLEQGLAIDLCRAALAIERPGPVDNPYYAYTIGNRIVLNGQALGVMVLLREDRPFGAAESRLLEIAQKQIDSAILQARLIWKLRQRTRELAGIAAIDRLREHLHSEPDALHAFSRYVQQQLDAELVLVSQVDGALISKVDLRGLPGDALSELTARAATLPPLTLVPTEHGLTGMILVTLRIGDASAGPIVVVGRGALLTAADLRWLSAICLQMSFVLEHIRLFRPAAAEVSDHASGGVRVEPPLHESLQYRDGTLHLDRVALADVAAQAGSPTYVYSLARIQANVARIKAAFPGARIRFSAKANNNPAVLREVIAAGAGIDAVSAGEIFMARRAGAAADKIVFAGVGKAIGEMYYAVSQGIGWFNIENAAEAAMINAVAAERGTPVRAALRLNPGVMANTIHKIATGHSAAKFGLSDEAIRVLLDSRGAYEFIRFEGLHIHIGSQLGDVSATVEAVQAALELMADFPFLTTLNLGGGFPVAYTADSVLPAANEFAAALLPLLKGQKLILEPGRSICADAGVLLTRVAYIKHQGGQAIVVLDAGMTDLIRPMLYDAVHAIIAVSPREGEWHPMQLVGPVCESTDVFARDRLMPPLEPGDLLAILTTGAYGAVQGSNYNARLRPAEVAVNADGLTWKITRRRDTWEDLVSRDVP